MKFRNLFFLLSFITLPFSPLRAQGETKKNLEDLLLLEMHLDQYVLADGISAYRKRDLIFLPLGELSQLLTLAITVDPVPKIARGFIISEDRTFLLDMNKQSVIINRIESSYDPQLVLMQENEIYIESKLYQSWFPIELNVDISALVLKISPKESLPIQSRLQRGKKNTENNSSQPDFINYDIPYSMIDRPFLDQTLEGSFIKNENAPSSFKGRYTTFLTGDLLGLESHLLASGSDEKNLENFRLTLGRNDSEGQLLGPAKARSFTIGSVSLPSQLYTVRSASNGVGATISNRLILRPTRFDTQDFKGDLLPGWDVELFHNGILLGHQNSNDKAKYEFNEIPLLFGGNDFRLVFHGPVGQIREEHVRFMLEDSLVLPGETFYSVGSAKLADGSTRTIAQLDKSIFQKVSANIGFVSDSLKNINLESDPSLTYYNFGLRSYIDPFFISTDTITASDGGSLGSINLKTNISNATLRISRAALHNFISEEFPTSTDPVLTNTQLGVDTFISFLNNAPMSVTGTQQIKTSGAETDLVAAKISTYLNGFAISNRLTYAASNGLNTTSGDLQISAKPNQINLRGAISYAVTPEIKPTSLNLNANELFQQGINFTQSLTGQFQSQDLRFEMGLNKSIGQYGLGFNVGGSNNNDYFANLTLNISAGVEPRSSHIFTNALPMNSAGAASLQTYLDNNLNGKMDEGDTPLENISFRVNGGLNPVKTDKNGIALLTHLPAGERVNLAIDRASVEDPQQTPIKKGIRLLSRPGKVSKIDFPFVVTTEIDGNIFYYRGAKSTAASNLKLELVDFSDPETVISRSTTAFDGYYILPEVPPGKYILQIEPHQAATLSIVKPKLKTLQILPNSNFINGLNFTIEEVQHSESKINENNLPIASVNEVSNLTNLNYVTLASESDPAYYQWALHKLRALQLKNVKRIIKGSVTSFQLILSFKSQESLSAAAEKLKLSNYSYTIITSSDKNEITMGSYLTYDDALNEKAILMASLTDAIIQITKNIELKNMSEIAIGGYKNAKNANKISDLLKQNGFININIKKTKPSDWNLDKTN